MQPIEIDIRVPTSSRDHHPGVDRWSPELTNRIMDNRGVLSFAHQITALIAMVVRNILF